MRAVEQNSFGVYTPHEKLELRHDRKGWLGLPLAEIRLLEQPQGWRHSIGYQFLSGNCAGRGEPIDDHSKVYPSRDAAISAGIARLRPSAERVDSTEARRMLAWLDSLRPAQMVLF